jgi:hypothetical protein
MLKKITGLALMPLLALGACTAAVPTQPTVVAMPGQGKSWDQFQADQATCRDYAASQMPDSGQVAVGTHNNSVATSAAGTLIGAGVGAALGSLAGNVGAGAAVGAGAGLLGGAAVAGNNTQATADSLQGRYDVAYAQCMVGHGESIQQPMAPVYAAPPPGYYAPPPGYYYAPY